MVINNYILESWILLVYITFTYQALTYCDEIRTRTLRVFQSASGFFFFGGCTGKLKGGQKAGACLTRIVAHVCVYDEEYVYHKESFEVDIMIFYSLGVVVVREQNWLLWESQQHITSFSRYICMHACICVCVYNNNNTAAVGGNSIKTLIYVRYSYMDSTKFWELLGVGGGGGPQRILLLRTCIFLN